MGARRKRRNGLRNVRSVLPDGADRSVVISITGDLKKRIPTYARHAEAGPTLGRFQLLFRIERQLDHALEQLISRQTRKVLQHQFFDIQPHEVA